MNTRVRFLCHTRLHIAMAVCLLSHAVYAHATTSVIYVCQGNGMVTLQNIQTPNKTATRTCDTKTITIRERPTQTASRPALRQAGDPMPTAQTLIVEAQVPSVVQQQRDFGRMQIVQSELGNAEQRLAKLQMEYSNSHPERSGNDKNDQEYLAHIAGLKQNIQLTRVNIDALKRELARIYSAQ